MKTRYFLAFLAAFCLAGPFLSATDIRSIDTEVWLHKNGNAVVHQRWDVTITGGTEWYIPIENLGDRNIRDLSVFEGERKYESDGRAWDSDRSLAQKMYRCGIAEKSNGVELCWGQGKVGDHVYDIIYIIDNLVKTSADGEDAMFNWQFLNDEWSAKPQHVSLKLYNMADSTRVWVAGEEGNMGIWVFGCEADYGVDEGEVHIESTEPFGYLDYLTVMMRFDKDMFAPFTTDSRTFEELREEAFFGSDYRLEEEDDEAKTKRFLGQVLRFFLFLGGFFLAIFLIFVLIPATIVKYWRRWTGIRYKKDIFGQKRITGWWRDVPLGGNLSAAYSLLDSGDHLSGGNSLFSRLVGAYFLRWVHKGLVVCEKDKDKEGRMNLRFTKASPDGYKSDDPLELKIYKGARLASGGNLLLENNEFKKWSEKNYTTVISWQDEARSAGRKVWQSCSNEKRCQLVQFRNYLEDFTLSKVHEAPEAALWEEYLVFAELFGIADKVSKNLEKLYPEIYREYLSRAHTSSTSDLFRSVSSSSASLLSAAISERNSRSYSSYSSSSSSSSSSRTRYYGGGGHSSHHGGGGHSGGGHGGGSR